VLAREHRDAAPRDVAAAAAAAAQELRVWHAMLDVRELAAKLFVRGERLGHDVFSLEARRWSPDAAARAEVRTAPGADPTLMRMVLLAGLLGDEASVAQRTTEYLCSGGAGAGLGCVRTCVCLGGYFNGGGGGSRCWAAAARRSASRSNGRCLPQSPLQPPISPRGLPSVQTPRGR
jgi:hypothetical protein